MGSGFPPHPHAEVSRPAPHNEIGGHNRYVIELRSHQHGHRSEAMHYLTAKRYSEFKRLHRNLKLGAQLEVSAPFPPKSWICKRLRGGRRSKFIADRCAGLNSWLAVVMKTVWLIAYEQPPQQLPPTRTCCCFRSQPENNTIIQDHLEMSATATEARGRANTTESSQQGSFFATL